MLRARPAWLEQGGGHKESGGAPSRQGRAGGSPRAIATFAFADVIWASSDKVTTAAELRPPWGWLPRGGGREGEVTGWCQGGDPGARQRMWVAMWERRGTIKENPSASGGSNCEGVAAGDRSRRGDLRRSGVGRKSPEERPGSQRAWGLGEVLGDTRGLRERAWAEGVIRQEYGAQAPNPEGLKEKGGPKARPRPAAGAQAQSVREGRSLVPALCHVEVAGSGGGDATPPVSWDWGLGLSHLGNEEAGDARRPEDLGTFALHL